MTEDNASRELTGEISISAPPQRVWAVLTDPATMPQASPELFSVTRRRKGPFRLGESFVGWNRRGLAVWATVNAVTGFEPEQELTWHTKSSGATWTYTLVADGDGTLLREQRRMSPTVPRTAKVFAAAFLGGLAHHTDELEEDVSTTLREIKKIAEQDG